MSTLANQMPRFYRDSFESLRSEQSLFMHVASASLPRALLPRVGVDPSGLLTVEFPLVEALGGRPENTTYLLGSDHVADGDAHRDLTPLGSLNCHLTLRGSMQGKGVIIDDEMHNEGGGLMVPFEEAVPANMIERVDAGIGDVYLFFGGRVTHEISSGEQGRLSVMRHYNFDL